MPDSAFLVALPLTCALQPPDEAGNIVRNRTPTFGRHQTPGTKHTSKLWGDATDEGARTEEHSSLVTAVDDLAAPLLLAHDRARRQKLDLHLQQVQGHRGLPPHLRGGVSAITLNLRDLRIDTTSSFFFEVTDKT